jgi:hypothetical protein
MSGEAVGNATAVRLPGRSLRKTSCGYRYSHHILPVAAFTAIISPAENPIGNV